MYGTQGSYQYMVQSCHLVRPGEQEGSLAVVNKMP